VTFDVDSLCIAAAAGGVLFGLASAAVAGRRRRADKEALRAATTSDETQRREITRLDTENARLDAELRETRRKHAVAASGGEKRAAAKGADPRGAEIVKLRKSLEAAQDSEVRQRAFFDGALEGMAILERETLKFLDVNASLVRIAGFDAAELTTRSLIDLFCTGPGKPGKTELLRSGREGRALMVEITRKDGRTVFVDVGVAVIGAGADARVLAVVHDVSERRLLEQELQLHLAAQNERERRLEDANRELALRAERIEGMNSRLEELQARKDDFVSTVSHELRTPLTSIRSFSEILLDYGDADESVRREFLGIIHKESKRLTRLVDDVLDLARIEADEARLDLTEFDAKDVVADAVNSMAGTAKARGAKVRIAAASEPMPLRADRDKVQQLVMNLLGNALKFGSKGGEVVVSASTAPTPGRIAFCVADDGPGLQPGELDRVFEKFRRSRDGQTGTAGTGLGLAICREIVKMHGGRIWAENRDEGGGKFCFELPGVPECLRAPADAPAAAEPPAVETPEPAVAVAAGAVAPAPSARREGGRPGDGVLPPIGQAKPRASEPPAS
jgi:PAS domain S-box-containing protein